MDSFDRYERLATWNGEAEPLFNALEAAIEAADLIPCQVEYHNGVRRRDVEQLAAPEWLSLLAEARTRVKHGPLPATVEIHVVRAGTGVDAMVYLSARDERIHVAGKGTDGATGQRAYDTARGVLIEQALAPMEAEG